MSRTAQSTVAYLAVSPGRSGIFRCARSAYERPCCCVSKSDDVASYRDCAVRQNPTLLSLTYPDARSRLGKPRHRSPSSLIAG